MNFCDQNHLTNIRSLGESLSTDIQESWIEAIDDYDDKRYRSCVLILFSIIDRYLIYLVDGHDKVGNAAIANLCETLRGKRVNVAMGLRAWGALSCVKVMYEKDKGFKNNHAVINRNFVAHGMWADPVTKKDCIQVIFLCWNLIETTDYILCGKGKV